ncbi:MAG: filamentous hemagglutinin N-terminal domain-containing protein, partial [Verrucomicrobiales bacterium]|nr:filamentous hemagglutinin N-terminal domain-containing protein [Verrucomicrobiales bacterium]
MQVTSSWLLIASITALDSIAQTLPQVAGSLPPGLAFGDTGQPASMLIEQSIGGNRIIDWQSFSISEEASVRFHLVDPLVTVLNRVGSGGPPSAIFGQLQSVYGAEQLPGGNLILVNPSGIAFGLNAQISVGSLVASTLPMSTSDEDFLNGASTLLFAVPAGTPFGEVANQGNPGSRNVINAARAGISLIGARVINEGKLEAPQGGVRMAAGSQVELRDYRDPELARVRVLTDVPAGGDEPLVDNRPGAVIDAVRTEIEAAGGNVYSLAINAEGVLKARTGDQIAAFLRVQSHSTIDANGGDARVRMDVQRVDKNTGDARPDGKLIAEAEGRNVSLAFSEGVELGSVKAARDLNVTVGGPLTQSDEIHVGGTSRFRIAAGLVEDRNLDDGSVQLSWSGPGTLEEAATVDGPWTPVNGVSGRTHTAELGYVYRLRDSDLEADVALGDYPNAFGGRVSVDAVGTSTVGDVVLLGAGDLELDALAISGSLEASAGPGSFLMLDGEIRAMSVDLGGANPNGNIVLAAGGTLATPNIETKGDQRYQATVRLGADTVLASLSGGTVTFDRNVDGSGSNSGLTVDGWTVLGGASISTGSGEQRYLDTVNLVGGPKTLTGGKVTFNGAVDGAWDSSGLRVAGAAELEG